jgi:N6-adenosine-specific RNA methylase IME4
MISKKKYKIIYADPPWKYDDEGCQGTAINHYKTMNNKDICELPIKDLADKDCVLFIWGTYPKIPEVLEVINAWGFEYKSIGFQWIKKNKRNGKWFYGLGRWTRGNTEPCFIAVKGKPKRISASVFQIIESPINGHSRKPEVVRSKIIELMGDLPRIELFARQRVEGWDAWGNEVPNEEQKELTKKVSEEKK